MKAAHIPRLVLALHVEAGGLMSYGTDVLDMYRQVGGWALPPRQLAERAIAAGLVDLPGTARVEQMVAGFGVDNGPADPACCSDLDALGREQEEAPTSMLPAGAVERIGPSRQILIDVERG